MHGTDEHGAGIDLLDLANEAWGGAVLWANDDFFAPKENLVLASTPVWKEGVYTERGKWMDGWESRRRRTSGHDMAIVRLGIPGTIERFLVDTSYFRGNYPEACSIDGCTMRADTPIEDLLDDDVWTEVLGRSDLEGHSQNVFDVADRRRYTHLRFHIYPDGGVARLRVYGRPVPEPWTLRGEKVDLVAGANGGATLAQSDMFFGLSQNLLKAHRGVNMGDGWETKRRRGPGHDWVVLQLAAHGSVDLAEVDTLHFKGNYPDRCSLELYESEPDEPAVPRAEAELFGEHELQAHTRHDVRPSRRDSGTHAVFRIYPDGGVSRLRLWGRLSDRGQRAVALRWLNAMSERSAEQVFRSCCGSEAWVSGMVDRLPFDTEHELLNAADEVWDALGHEDWLEAFAAHPRIGGKKAQKTTTTESVKWSEQEQAGTDAANDDVKSTLASLNEEYYDKHGFIFIICATGKSAEEMLASLEQRVANDTATEVVNAAKEQAAITKLRLEKWLHDCGPARH